MILLILQSFIYFFYRSNYFLNNLLFSSKLLFDQILAKVTILTFKVDVAKFCNESDNDIYIKCISLLRTRV